MPQDPWATAALLVLAASLPSLIYVAVLRNSERVGRASWTGLLGALLYGAIGSVVLVVVFDLLFGDVLNRFLQRQLLMSAELVAVVAAAPIVEEFFKGYGLKHSRGRIREVEDGIVYAGAVALGFAATENLLYQGSAFLAGGQAAWWNVVVSRSISSSLLHPTATGLIGLGYGKYVLRGTSRIRLIPYYLGAVVLHGVYNYAATTGMVLRPGIPVHLPVAIVIAVVGFLLLRRQISRWDRRPAQAA